MLYGTKSVQKEIKMDGRSLNIYRDKIEKLKSIIPEAFTEKRIDWEKLKAALGEDIEFKNERYVLNWAGKSNAFKVLQALTTATLVPDRAASVNFDETGHVFIEGENLEVLKVLQKSYFGKIKMIYIDPPYNTGNDTFIYPDRFSETRDAYFERIGDKDEAGYMTREGLFRKNSKDSGHYHSNWLSMMYPRLFLARNLLKEDGVIFVSIDDNEVHNLRLLMNEVFGEENCLGCITIVSNLKGRSDDKYYATAHNYLLIYTRGEFESMGVPLPEEYWDDYPETDADGKRYRLLGLRKRGSGARREDRPNMFFSVFVDKKSGKVSLKKSSIFSEEVIPKLSDGSDGRWRWGKETVSNRIEDLMGKTVGADKRWDVFQIDFAENDEGAKRIKPKTIWTGSEFANEYGTLETKKILGKKIFDNPKPTGLIKYCLEHATTNKDIILDFFSGSCTTAHAVLDLNKQDNGNRKFICVQLPEKCDEKTEAFKAGYKTIADIGKERICRVIKKIKDSENGNLPFEKAKQDLGFKAFTLQSSNFKIWQGDNIENGKQLEKQMLLHLDSVKKDAEKENMLFELLLKSGRDLNSAIENTGDYYRINDKEMIIALTKIDEKIVNAILKDKPQIFITLDRLFENNDQLKTNTLLQMKDAGIGFKVV